MSAICEKESGEGKVTTSTIEGTLRRIDALNLDPILSKLVQPEPDVEGVSEAQAMRAVMKYRRFLKLIVMHPGVTIVPSREVDEVWHNHILDTRKYADDCAAVFGFFLHHFPYLGMRGEADERSWRASFARTCELYKEHFGEEFRDLASVSGQLPAGTCGGGSGGNNASIGG